MRDRPFQLLDAAELAYGANVCNGDYGEEAPVLGCRPATYVVSNLASLLLLPVQGERAPRTQGIAGTLGMNKYTEDEIDAAFDRIDKDGNGVIDGEEVQQFLESVYGDTYGHDTIQEDRKDSWHCSNSWKAVTKEKNWSKFRQKKMRSAWWSALRPC